LIFMEASAKTAQNVEEVSEILQISMLERVFFVVLFGLII